MKGIELPINILVIVALAIIVLLGITSLFMGGFGQGATGLTLESVKTQACQELIRLGKCGNWDGPSSIKVNFDANKDGKIDANDNLADLCTNYYGAPKLSSNPTDPEKIAFRTACNVRVCGCAV